MRKWKQRTEEEEKQYQQWLEEQRRKNEEYAILEKIGFIYIIRCGNTTYHKIGLTHKKLGTGLSRLSGIQVGCPYELFMVSCHKVDDCEKVEKYIHSRFDIQRIRGEWFDLSEDNIHEIEEELRKFYTDKVGVWKCDKCE